MMIDTHVHIGGDKVGFEMKEALVLGAMEKYNIDYALVSNADAVEVDHEQKPIPQEFQVSQEDALRRVLTFARENEGRIGVGVWVKPRFETVTPELEKLIAENLDIIYAIKLHPYHSNISPIDKRTLPYLELAKKYHLAVVSHTGGCEAAEPIHMYEAAKLFPEIPFVMVHMGLGSDNKEALDLLGKADNLYGDTAWVPMSTTIEAIKRYGSKKMMFGSDAPIDGLDTYLCNPKGERSMYQDYFHVLPEKIGKEAYEDLMWRNAMEILGLKNIDEYSKQAKEQWGKTDAYKEFEEKSKAWKDNPAKDKELEQECMEMFAEFGKIKEKDPASEEAQAMVKRWQDFITENFYNCTPQILSALGRMYSGGGDFTTNIDKMGGAGTAEFTAKAIEVYCKK